MQKVERRRHRKRRPGRLAVVLLCAAFLAAGVTAGLLLHRTAEEESGEGLPAARERITGSIIQRTTDEVDSVTVTQRGKTPWTVVQTRHSILEMKPEEGSGEAAWTVDSDMTRIIIDIASNLEYSDVFTENRADWEPEAKEFGFLDPLVTAEFRFTDGTQVTVKVGNSTDPADNDSYFMTVDGDDRLFALDAGTVNDLNTEKELLHPVPTPVVRSSLLDRITVKNGDGTVRTEWTLQGDVKDQDAAENWLMTAPVVYPADYDQVKNLKKNAENLLLGVYVGEADEETLNRCGLDEPTAVIELHMAAGTTGTIGVTGAYDIQECEERTETFIIGSKKNDLTAYARYGDQVFTVGNFSIDVFVKAKPMDTIARYVVITPLNSMDSLTVEKQGEETVRYKIERKAVSEASDTDENDGYSCTKNGEEIDYKVLSANWDRLLTVTVSGRLPKDYEPQAVHTRYTFHTVSGKTHVLELRDFDAMQDAVTLDGHTLFYLIKGGMTQLP